MCGSVFLNNIQKNRLDYPIYFVLLAEIIASRSKDPNSKHGCIITDSEYRIISTGYNGAVQGIDDSKIPLTRPEKYKYFIHAEMNALLFARTNLKNCYAFITGPSCSSCIRSLIQAGITKIYWGNKPAKMIDDEDMKAVNLMIKESGILIQSVDFDSIIHK
jgi:dCMP deaminase